ncbi:MAG: hypothetical protein P8180_05530 [Gammaproteobacteria bacterium]|jgi:hypothetical protein
MAAANTNLSYEWWRPVCHYCSVLHRVTAVSGLVLLGGDSLVEFFGLQAAPWEVAGIILGFLFAFVLIGNVPLALATLWLCRSDPGLVAQSALLLIVAAVAWYLEDEAIITAVFFAYSLVVLSVAWKRAG